MIRIILLIIYLGSVLMIKNEATGTLCDDQKHSVALNAFATTMAEKPALLTYIFQSLSRAQCLCHSPQPSANAQRHPSFNRSVALNAFATLVGLIVGAAIFDFQSLSRAQCLCHYVMFIVHLVARDAFNRSVALNAFATTPDLK